MTESMRALVINGPGSATVEYVEAPTPGNGQIVVDVCRVGICGTDRELFTGTLPYFAQGKSRFPLRPGHEWCGTVSAIGAGVDPGWYGTRVTADTMLGCGDCSRCRAGHGHVCAARDEIGIMGRWPGALAEKVLVPVSSVHRLPDSLDDCAGALVEPGGNAWRAAAAACAGPGKRILVWGAGTIGLLTVAFAHSSGAEVHMLALDHRRAELAKLFGADHFWTTDSKPMGTYSAVIDCTDDPHVPRAALGLVEPAGRLVCIGVSPSPSLLDSRDLVFSDITAVGILGASAGLAPAIAQYAKGLVAPRRLVDRAIGLDCAPDALAGQLSAESGTKIHIDPRK